MGKSLKPNIQLFAEPAPPEPTPPTPPAPPAPPKDPEPLNFDELIKTDTGFQSWLDKRVTTATNTAVQNAQTKWNKLHDDKLTEAERLKNMTAEEKASYFQKKYEDAQATQQRRDNARTLEKETAKMFSENKIPDELLATIDFDNATAEQVQERVKLLSGYEIYPKGTFDTKLEEALNAKLRQPSPQSHNPAGGAEDYEALLKKAQDENNMQLIAFYSRKIAEQKAK